MAIYLTAASSQYLSTSTFSSMVVATGYPLIVGMWINLAAVGSSARTVFGFSDTGTTNNYLLVRMDSTEAIANVAAAGGAEVTGTAGLSLVANRWTYVLHRFRTATSRRWSIWQPGSTQIYTTSSNGTSTAPTGLDLMTIGGTKTSAAAANFWDGALAEYWISTVDPFPRAVDLPGEIMAHLALGGPFAFPGMAAGLIEYRSFRQGIGSDYDTDGDVWYRDVRPQWTVVNGPLRLAPHPPLPGSYVRPNQTIRNLMV